MTNNPANRGVGGHIKEGVKNIKTTYNALYNRPGPGGGATTAANNVKLIATGRTSPGMPKQSAGLRAGVAAMGAASVTPLGPVAAFGMGVAKSVKDKNKAVAAQNTPPAAAPAAKAPPKLKIKANAPGTGNVPPAAPAPKPAAKIGTHRPKN